MVLLFGHNRSVFVSGEFFGNISCNVLSSGTIVFNNGHIWQLWRFKFIITKFGKWIKQYSELWFIHFSENDIYSYYMGIPVLMFFSCVCVFCFFTIFSSSGFMAVIYNLKGFPTGHSYIWWLRWILIQRTADFTSYMSCVTARTATIEIVFRNNVYKRHKKFISKIY